MNNEIVSLINSFTRFLLFSKYHVFPTVHCSEKSHISLDCLHIVSSRKTDDFACGHKIRRHQLTGSLLVIKRALLQYASCRK